MYIYVCIYVYRQVGLTSDREYKMEREATPSLLTSGIKILPIRIGFTNCTSVAFGWEMSLVIPNLLAPAARCRNDD